MLYDCVLPALLPKGLERLSDASSWRLTRLGPFFKDFSKLSGLRALPVDTAAVEQNLIFDLLCPSLMSSSVDPKSIHISCCFFSSSESASLTIFSRQLLCCSRGIETQKSARASALCQRIYLFGYLEFVLDWVWASPLTAMPMEFSPP